MTVDQIRQKYYEQKAREEILRKTAINLLKMGMTEDIVAEGTGLSIEEIKEISNFVASSSKLPLRSREFPVTSVLL